MRAIDRRGAGVAELCPTRAAPGFWRACLRRLSDCSVPVGSRLEGIKYVIFWLQHEVDFDAMVLFHATDEGEVARLT